ncbi:MAG: DUF4321 domain-containing protein [Ruminococcaceae bacterium]|nr:DUF4321 domain-containing protein [Oscillospiraceae bacterium]
MKNAGKNFLFFFYLISGIVLGSLLAAVSKEIPWLSWLEFGTTVGFGHPQPAVLDLSVFLLSIGISFTITIAHIITIGIAMFLYFKFKR